MKPVIFSVKAEHDQALSFIRELGERCQHIGQFPESYRRFSELGPDARMMPHGNYVVLVSCIG